MTDISSNNKRIAKNTLYLYGRMLLSLVVSLYTARVTLRVLGVEDYGLFNVVAGVLGLFTFLNGTLSTATSRFITYELGKPGSNEVRTVFRNAYTLHFIVAMMIVVLGETVGLYMVNYVLTIPPDRLFACNVLYQTVILSTTISIIQMANGALIIAHERMSFYALTGLTSTFLKLCVAIAIQFIPFDKLISLALMNLAITMGFAFWQDHYCRVNFPKIFTMRLGLDRKISHEMIHFSIWQLIGAMAFMLRMQGISVLMNTFFGAIANAANAIAYQVNTAVNGFVSNFTTAVNPQITKNYAAGEYNAMRSLIYRAGKISFFLLAILCAPIILNTEFILTLWLGNDYPQYTAIMTRLVLIIAMTESYTFSIGCAINATGCVRDYQLVICGIMLLIFPFTWIWYKLGGAPYVGLIVYLCTSILALFSRLYFMKKQLDIPYRTYICQVFLRTIPIAVIGMTLPLLIKSRISIAWLDFILTSLASEIIILTATWYIGFQKNERRSIANLIKTKILRRPANA